MSDFISHEYPHSQSDYQSYEEGGSNSNHIRVTFGFYLIIHSVLTYIMALILVANRGVVKQVLQYPHCVEEEIRVERNCITCSSHGDNKQRQCVGRCAK